MDEAISEETKKRRNPWMLSTIGLIIILVIFLIAGPITGMLVSDNNLSSGEAANKALDFIKENLVQPNTTISLVSVNEIDNMYNITISIEDSEMPIYITKGGNFLLFPGGWLNIPEFEKAKQEAEQQQTEAEQEYDAPDREKPNVKFFVMSFCPYGNQAENGLEPVFRLLGDKVEWEPRYVIYSNYASGYPDYCLDEENKYCSMHGIQELNQDVREMCVWKYYPATTWWDFVMKINEKCSYTDVDVCWEDIAKEFNIDIEKIKTCQREEAVDLLEEEVIIGKEYNVMGSPTVFINDQDYGGERSPDAYKQAICSGFVTQPEECSQTLSASGGSSSGTC